MNKSILSKVKYLATPFRRSPDYMVLGAQKSGTSTLFNLLSEHPDIHNPYQKEIHFFDWNYDKSFFWYKSNFPINRGKLTGEATPIYLFHPDIPGRVHKDLPNCKFIIVLRNPIERCYSHYQMGIRKGFETLTFEEALREEPGRMSQALESMHQTNAHYSIELQQFSYLSRGLYYDQLIKWFSFFSKDQFHILSFESFVQNTQLEFQRICDFLQIQTHKISTVPIINQDSYTPMSSSTRSMLQARFAPHNAQLFELLGTSFPWN